MRCRSSFCTVGRDLRNVRAVDRRGLDPAEVLVSAHLAANAPARNTAREAETRADEERLRREDRLRHAEPLRGRGMDDLALVREEGPARHFVGHVEVQCALFDDVLEERKDVAGVEKARVGRQRSR